MRREINISITIENDELVDVKIGGVRAPDGNKTGKSNRRVKQSDIVKADNGLREFWDLFRTRLQWDVVPYNFLFALYSKWFIRNKRAAKVNLKYSEFLFLLRDMISEDDIWFCKDDKDTKIRVTQGAMSKPELLILDYDLKEWRNSSYRGDDIEKICIPDPIETVRGIKRLKVTKKN